VIDFHAKVLADSVTNDNRITTMELTYPRCIHSEFMTHRSHSRNAASSRAIPISRILKNVKESPFIPLHWGANQAGMQADSVLSDHKQKECRVEWLIARDEMLRTVTVLNGIGLHKQIANRLLEPWMWITVITTANDRGWANFFGLRCHKDAEPHIQKIAYMARDAMDGSDPQYLGKGDWHLPLIGFAGDDGLTSMDQVRACVGRCARVSYLTHDGIRDTSKDIELHDRLMESGHWSPFEHAARPALFREPGLGGNLGLGWVQYRKLFAGECA